MHLHVYFPRYLASYYSDASFSSVWRSGFITDWTSLVLLTLVVKLVDLKIDLKIVPFEDPRPKGFIVFFTSLGIFVALVKFFHAIIFFPVH